MAPLVEYLPSNHETLSSNSSTTERKKRRKGREGKGMKIIKKQRGKFLESNEKEKTTNQNLWDTAKAVLREKL
jgi:hypothetical protein